MLPNVGTDDAVGGAASTKIRSNRRKLENRLMAVGEIKKK